MTLHRKSSIPTTPNSRSHGEYETAVPIHYGVERNLIFVDRNKRDGKF